MRQILFKEGVSQRELAGLHPRLIEVVDYASETAWTIYRELLVCTCIVRKKRLTEGDTHYLQPVPYRFIDFAKLVKGDTERLRQMINREFEYDPARPHLLTVPALDHPGTAEHLHLQVRAG